MKCIQQMFLNDEQEGAGADSPGIFLINLYLIWMHEEEIYFIYSWILKTNDWERKVTTFIKHKG